MLNRLFHIAINSTDLERSVAFYKRLGFQVMAEREVHNEQVKKAFAVLTDDTDVVYRELAADGVSFLTEPTTVMTPEGGWKVCLALDPDGVVVQITELVPALVEA